MKLIDKGNKDADPVHVPFDAAMDALASGAFEAHPIEGERGPDQPAAQSPKPGTDPVDGKEQPAPDSPLTNITPVGIEPSPAPGMPKEPEAPKENVVKASQVAAPAPQPATGATPAKAPAGK